MAWNNELVLLVIVAGFCINRTVSLRCYEVAEQPWNGPIQMPSDAGIACPRGMTEGCFMRLTKSTYELGCAAVASGTQCAITANHNETYCTCRADKCNRGSEWLEDLWSQSGDDEKQILHLPLGVDKYTQLSLSMRNLRCWHGTVYPDLYESDPLRLILCRGKVQSCYVKAEDDILEFGCLNDDMSPSTEVESCMDLTEVGICQCTTNRCNSVAWAENMDTKSMEVKRLFDLITSNGQSRVKPWTIISIILISAWLVALNKHLVAVSFFSYFCCIN